MLYLNTLNNQIVPENKIDHISSENNDEITSFRNTNITDINNPNDNQNDNRNDNLNLNDNQTRLNYDLINIRPNTSSNRRYLPPLNNYTYRSNNNRNHHIMRNNRVASRFELSPLLSALNRLDHTILSRTEIIPHSHYNYITVIINDVIYPSEIIYAISDLYQDILNNVEVQSTPISGSVKIIINNIVNTLTNNANNANNANNPTHNNVRPRRIKICLLDNYVFQDTESNYQECPICLEDFQNGETVKKLPCNHLFHSDCIISWFKQQKKYPAECPTCKAKVR